VTLRRKSIMIWPIDTMRKQRRAQLNFAPFRDVRVRYAILHCYLIWVEMPRGGVFRPRPARSRALFGRPGIGSEGPRYCRVTRWQRHFSGERAFARLAGAAMLPVEQLAAIES
jgi:hypothetical protein